MRRNVRKYFLTGLFLIYSFRVFAPVDRSVELLRNDPVEPFRNLIHAIGMVETEQDTLAFNPFEQAVGYFQIRPIRLVDYNARTGSTYTMGDLFRYDVSEKIFLYYACCFGPYNPEKIARSWNGSGVSTAIYWEQVRKFL